MRKHLLLPTLLLLALCGYAQTPDSSASTDTSIGNYCLQEWEPEFPGGMKALYAYLDSAVRYPQVALDHHIEGKIYVTFVVEKDGSVTNPRVLRGLPGGCCRAAIDAVKRMPRWEPGRQYCTSDRTLVPVRVQFNLPVHFRLDPQQPHTVGGSEAGDKEVIATFPGGTEALYRHLATHIDRPAEEWTGVLCPLLDFDSVGNVVGVRLPDYNPMADAIREVFLSMPRWNVPPMEVCHFDHPPLLAVPIDLPLLLELRNK